MKILILGITGMLGHTVWLNLRDKHETFGTVRGSVQELSKKSSFFKERQDAIIEEVDVLKDEDIEKALEMAEPDVIVNCVGLIKQFKDAKYPIPTIYLNALFPHRLAQMCDKHKVRIIHISTDCVFSGNKGNYVESDISDAYDLYGRTKFLGELTGENCLTIRTSIIDRELTGASSVLEWFLSQKKQVRGYRKAIFSGLTSYSLADIIRTLIEGHPTVDGLYHVSSEPIDCCAGSKGH